MLEPPVGFGKVVEGTDEEVVITVSGGSSVTEGVVYTFCCLGCCMGGCGCYEGGGGDKGGFEHCESFFGGNE